jgi:hypothetical protein
MTHTHHTPHPTPHTHNTQHTQTLKEYCEKGHDTKYFRDFTLEVEDIFAVKRVGADELFAPWKDNTNRQLLWHVREFTTFSNHTDCVCACVSVCAVVRAHTIDG